MANLISDPNRLVFESDIDIVNYISGGLRAPSRAEFNAVMETIRVGPRIEILQENGDPMPQVTPVNPHVRINFNAVPDNALLERYMREVYRNRKTTNQIHLAIGAVAVLGALRLGMCWGERSAEKEFEKEHR